MPRMPILTLYLALLAAAFVSGFFYGHNLSGRQALQSALAAYNMRQKVDRNVEKMDNIELCHALGGLRADCRAVLRRVGGAAKAE